jgi:hypothetical protein
MTESDKTSLGAALTRVMVTPAEAHVFLSSLAALVGHEGITASISAVANDLAYEPEPAPKTTSTSTKSST